MISIDAKMGKKEELIWNEIKNELLFLALSLAPSLVTDLRGNK